MLEAKFFHSSEFSTEISLFCILFIMYNYTFADSQCFIILTIAYRTNIAVTSQNIWISLMYIRYFLFQIWQSTLSWTSTPNIFQPVLVVKVHKNWKTLTYMTLNYRKCVGCKREFGSSGLRMLFNQNWTFTKRAYSASLQKQICTMILNTS